MYPEITVHLAQEGTHLTWLELMKIGGVSCAFLIGLWQYHKAQVWKRLEFVAGEMKAFFDDEAASAAMTMLDWSRKEIQLFRFRNPDDSTSETVTYEIVKASLGTERGKRHNKVESAVREIFDRFLSYLERFEGFIETGAVKQKDLKPYLHYWTKLLSGSNCHSPLVSIEVLPQLWAFVDHYGYDKVRHFVGRYDEIRFEVETQSQITRES